MSERSPAPSNRRPPRTILANLVSEVMAEHPTDAYRRAMAAVTPRKLWQARPGDCVVALAPVGATFREYVNRIIGLDVDQVDVVAPSEVRGVHALDVASELGATDRIVERPELAPFVPDRPVLDFCGRAGLRVLPYRRFPEESVLTSIMEINTKNGFRAAAASLGLPIAEGGHANSPAELADALTPFLADHPAAIIKRNRGSNGFGNIVVRPQAGRPVAQLVHDALGGQPAPGFGWVYEEFLPFTSAPSLELEVDDEGVSEFYSCDQRTINNAWTGMVTPAAEGEYQQDLRKAAAAVGGWLFDRGYRGVYDVDCGVYDGGFVVTEANVRRTGGSYLEELARLLRPGTSPVHWRADARVGTGELDFATAVARLDDAGVTDPTADARAVLTADTLAIDGKRRYLVVGRDAAAVAAVEEQVTRELGIS